ncbi:MAG: LCP family protein [Firmicutes bacterium]|nr:LCP family protein [Bacillota bacterium]
MADIEPGLGGLESVLSPEEVAQKKQEMEMKRELKREKRRRRSLFALIVGIVALVLMIGTAIITYRMGTRGVQQGAADPERTNILVLGADKGEYDPGRTDTIILVSVDPKAKEVGVLSVPRDTRVMIPGRGYNRINTAYAFGGPQLAKKTVENWLGIDIDYYVVVDFAGFEHIVDTLGGVEIDVEKRMRYQDRAQGLHIDLHPGRQVLDGRQALNYIRYRADGLGDVSLVDPVQELYGGRVQRQQRFLEALARELVKPTVIAKVPALIDDFRSAVQTDMPAQTMVKLGLALRDMDLQKVKSRVVPGVGGEIGSASYWLADQDKLKRVVQDLFHSTPVVTVQVLNGNGQSGVARQVAQSLQGEGYDVVTVGNAARFDYQQTEVHFRQDREQVARRIADLLHSQAVIKASPEDLETDVVVILGKDLRL